MFSQQRLHHRHLLLNDFFLKRLVKFRWDNFVELMRKKSVYSLNKTFQMKMFWPRTLFFALLSKLNELAHVANETLERHVFFLLLGSRQKCFSPNMCPRNSSAMQFRKYRVSWCNMFVLLVWGIKTTTINFYSSSDDWQLCPLCSENFLSSGAGGTYCGNDIKLLKYHKTIRKYSRLI